MTSTPRSTSDPTDIQQDDAPEGIRRPYHGSCHCGATRYIAFLTLPPLRLTGNTRVKKAPTPVTRLRKCNCTVCHKFAFFHVRFPSAPDDFLLLSPLDPFAELGDYRCWEGRTHWFFCKSCGVRCFGFIGEGEVSERDIPFVKIPIRDPATGKETGVEEIVGKKRVWTPKREGWKEGSGSYLSLNAHTLDAKQEGLDLREWAEKKWICYLDCLDETGEDNYDKPHEGGTY
jgi:hypothetical protein